jgi:hypothetical protein
VPPDCAWHKGKPEALPPNPKATYGSLMSQCRGIQSEQEGYAASFRAGDTILDMKYWFARVYSFVTKFEIEEVSNGLYDYPLMKMQEVVGFEAIYKQNIENWSTGNKENVDNNWNEITGRDERSFAVNAGTYPLRSSARNCGCVRGELRGHPGIVYGRFPS